MNSSERRMKPRVNLRVPMRFRIVDNCYGSEQIGEAENVSESGIYLVTNHPLKVGTTLEVSLRMPTELSGQPVINVRCRARVVHAQPDALPGRMNGFGLSIEQYIAAPAPVDRWAN